MKSLKTFLFYSGWSIFWFVLLIGAIWFSVETKMFRFLAPILFLSFIGYAFYAMLKTKPSPPTDEKQSPTSDTKSDAGTQSK
jgi:hypothetical protein